MAEPIWGLALANGLQSRSYLLVTSSAPFTEQVEERLVRDVNGTGLLPVCMIGSTQTGHRKPVKILSGKQKNALRDETRLLWMRTWTPLNFVIHREIKHEEIQSLAVRCEGNLVTHRP